MHFLGTTKHRCVSTGFEMRNLRTRAYLLLMAFSILSVTVTYAVPIKLVDGSIIEGEIVRRDDSTVTLRSSSLGDLRVRLNQVAKITAVGADTLAQASRADTLGHSPAKPISSAGSTSEAVGTQGSGSPADQALFFMPTAFTPKKGTVSFRDFELLFLTLGFSPTNTSSITGGFLFPLSSDVQVLTVGVKQRLWMAEDGHAALAVTANYTNPIGNLADTYTGIFNSNLVASYRLPFADDPKLDGTGAHLALGYLGGSAVQDNYPGNKSTHWERTYSFAAGAEARMSPYSKMIVEYLSGAPFDPKNDFNGGILTLGVRLHGNRLSADIAGMRPITDSDLGSFVFWPLLIVTYRM